MTKHPCGCVTTPDPTWYATKSVKKCAHHVQYRRDHPSGGQVYYESLGSLVNGTFCPGKYLEELTGALGKLPPAPPGGGMAVEIGTGVSPYVSHLKSLGYSYVGFEPDPWAAQWMRDNHHVHMENRCFEELEAAATGQAQLVLCAHAAEHMPDSPGALREMYRLLAPGRPLYLIVPDDTDLTNPDHLWFYTADSLRYVLTRLGFEDVKIVMKKVVEHENFLYCVARKPNGN
mgnify:CR=1 FL=1